MSTRIVFGTLALPDAPLGFELLDRFREAGGRALDLANVYREGASQKIVGAWLDERGVRDDMVVYAKGCHPPACSPKHVRNEVETVRRAARLERIDVFLLHRDDPTFSVAAWAEALLAEVAAGRIGAFGVSNWTLERTRELHDHLADRAQGGLTAFSNHFSLAEMGEHPRRPVSLRL